MCIIWAEEGQRIVMLGTASLNGQLLFRQNPVVTCWITIMEVAQILWELKDLNHPIIKMACGAIIARNIQKKLVESFSPFVQVATIEVEHMDNKVARSIWLIVNLLTRETQNLIAQKWGCLIKKKLKNLKILSPD